MWGITSHQSEWLSAKNPQTINAGEGAERRKPSYTVGGNVNDYSHCGEQYERFLKKNKNRATIWPYAIPLLGIYPDKSMIRKDTCIPMFIPSLFTTVKTWKQPKCPSTEDWIKKMWCTYTVEYYSAIKKNEKCHLHQHGWTRQCHTEWSQSERKGKISYDIPYIWNIKRNYTNELIYKTERDSQT